MKKPIAFIVSQKDGWIPPAVGSGYDQVNNSSSGYVGHVIKDPQLKGAPSGFYITPDGSPGRYRDIVHFIENEEFEARLKFVDAPKNFRFKDIDQNNTLSMFRTEFLDLITRTSIANDRSINGVWRILKRGNTQGIALVREFPDA